MKTYQFGKTVVKVESHLLSLTSEERSQWITEETARNNPVLNAIENAVHEMYESHSKKL